MVPRPQATRSTLRQNEARVLRTRMVSRTDRACKQPAFRPWLSVLAQPAPVDRIEQTFYPEVMAPPRYVETLCQSALNRVQGMPFRWSLNPYGGCRHGCLY